MKKLAGVLVLLVVTTVKAQDDPSGFVPLLNQARAARGLAPVRHDAAAAAVAAINNQHQLARGLGHHYLGGYGQVAGVGLVDARAALDAWSGSPSHAALLFAPDLVAVGFSQIGGCVTASTQQNFAAMGLYPVAYHYPVYYWRR